MRRAQLGFWISRLEVLRSFQQLGGIAWRVVRKPTPPPQNMQEISDLLEQGDDERLGDALDRLSKGPS